MPEGKLISALVLALLLGLGPSRPAAAYSRAELPDVPGVFLAWPTRQLSYSLNQKGCPGLTLPQLETAVAAAFALWSTPDCTDITFDYLGTVASEQTNLTLGQGQAPDGQNLLVWHQDSWPPAGVTDASITEEMPAVTSVRFDTQTGEIFDADVDLDALDFSWGVLDEGDRSAFADVQSILAHEVGHLLGLGHSKDHQATMYGTVAAGETKKRTLAADDIAGLCFVYPAGQPTPAGPGASDPPGSDEGGCSVAAGTPGEKLPGEGGGWLWGLLGAAALWRLAKGAGRR